MPWSHWVSCGEPVGTAVATGTFAQTQGDQGAVVLPVGEVQM